MDFWVSVNQHRLHTAICFINARATELTLCPVIDAANIEVLRTGGGPGQLPAVAPLGGESHCFLS